MPHGEEALIARHIINNPGNPSQAFVWDAYVPVEFIKT
jgi:hypothetical protein